jgi:beta-N-acetylhexosaminidase
VVSRGAVTLSGAPVVLELHDDPSLAAGPVPWGIGAPLAERMPGTAVLSIRDRGPSPQEILARYPGRPVVMSVRDVRSRAWQKEVINAVRELVPDAIVVDHGMPEPESFDEPYVLAFGASRVAADTVADLIAGAWSATRHPGA